MDHQARPLGTLGLIGRAVATYGWDLVAPLATFTLDVAGQALVPTIVAKREGILDVEAYNASRGVDLIGEDAVDDEPQHAHVGAST